MLNLNLMIIGCTDDERNMLRIHRRALRDYTDPFRIPESRFIELFRLNKDAALALVNEIDPHMRNAIRNTYIPKNIRVCATLHFYATGSFLRDCGQDFVCPISKTMMSRIVHEVTKIIETKLMAKYISFPKTEEEKNAIKQRFFNATGFPGVIGAIDCTQIKIKKPSIQVEHCYINRKGYFSKNVQLICDYDLKILGCLARFAGGSHDAFIWESSVVKGFLENNYLQNKSEDWLIGDSGYPLQPWLMTPFRNPVNSDQISYNDHHIQARNCIERLNGVLKKVWACLSHDRGLIFDPAFAGSVINSCCVLHNFRKNYNISLPQLNENTSVENISEDAEIITDSFFTEATAIRNRLVRNYFQQ